MKKAVWMALASVAVTAGPAWAGTLEADAAAFGARPSILDISLSPDGTKVAYIAPDNAAGEVVYIADLTKADEVPRSVTRYSEGGAELSNCDWATNDRLVCQVYVIKPDSGLLLGFSRLLSFGSDGSGVQMLSVRDTFRQLGTRQDGGDVVALDLPTVDGAVLMTREWIKEQVTGSRVANDQEGLGVDQVDVVNGRRRQAEAPDPAAIAYIADEQGRVRLKIRQDRDDETGVLGTRRTYLYRAADSNEWQRLSQVDVGNGGNDGFYPVAVDSALNVAYGFEHLNGFDTLQAVSLDGSGQKREVLSRDGIDVDGLIRIGRQRRVVGASYATERREVAIFDPALKRLTDRLRTALPQHPLIQIVGASADEKQLLVLASSDTDPGMVYHLDRGTMAMSEVLPMRDQLAGRPLAPMQAITYTAADGTKVPGYLTLPAGITLDAQGKPSTSGVPAVVLPHGGPGARDEWGFDWLVQFFAAQGYAVLQPNYRGSSGYGSAWYGQNGFRQWRSAIGDVNDAGRWLVSQGIADPAKLAIVGWSYGGYAALQSQVLDPSLYKAVVAVAPVTDLEGLRNESRNYTNYRLVAQFLGTGPHMEEGSPAQNVAAIQAPVLLAHGTFDQNVGVAQSRLMRDRLQAAGKPVEYAEYAGHAHSLNDSTVRTDLLLRIGRFLAKNLPR